MSDTGPSTSGSNAPADDGGVGGDTTDTTETATEGRTFTQADVDRVVKERLAKERSKIGDLNELRRKAGEFERLEQAKKTEVEQLSEKATQAEDRATKAELAAMRLDVAFDKAPEGMPVSKVRALAKRLTGSTQEELEADAEELFAEFADTKPAGGDGQTKPDPDQRPRESMGSVPLPGGDRIQIDESTDPRELAKRIRT